MTMRRFVFCALAALLFACASPIAFAASGGSSSRELLSLAPDWRYADGDHADAQSPGFDDSGWQQVTLPHTWNADDAFESGTCGW